jgi:hypothetical protein
MISDDSSSRKNSSNSWIHAERNIMICDASNTQVEPFDLEGALEEQLDQDGVANNILMCDPARSSTTNKRAKNSTSSCKEKLGFSFQ